MRALQQRTHIKALPKQKIPPRLQKRTTKTKSKNQNPQLVPKKQAEKTRLLKTTSNKKRQTNKRTRNTKAPTKTTNTTNDQRTTNRTNNGMVLPETQTIHKGLRKETIRNRTTNKINAVSMRKPAG